MEVVKDNSNNNNNVNDNDNNRATNTATTLSSVVNVEDATPSIISESLIAFTKDIFYQNYCKELILKILLIIVQRKRRRGSREINETTTIEPPESSSTSRIRTRREDNNYDNDTANHRFINNDEDDEDDDDDDEIENHYHPMLEPISECISSILYSILVLNRLQRTYGMEVCQLQYDNTNDNSKTVLRSENNIVTTNNNNHKQQRIRVVMTSITSSLWILLIKYLSYRSIVSKNHNQIHDHTTNESLRGIQRREYFERQRQAMLQRSTTTTSSSLENTNKNISTMSSLVYSTKTTSLLQRIQVNIINPFVQALSKALSYDILLLDGPHGLIEEDNARTTQTATISDSNNSNGTNNNTTINNSHNESNVDILYTIILALFKTHFAFYCINNNNNNSQYPINLIHRLIMMMYPNTKIQPEKNKSQQKQKQQSSSIVLQSESFRMTQKMVGYMILVQACTSVIQCISKKIIHILIDRRRRMRNETTSSSSSSSTAMNNGIANSNPIPVPSFPIEGIVSNTVNSRTSRPTIHSTFSSYNNNATSTNTNICVICRGQRQYSSCPISCGHLFCWYCIHEWISKTPSCPVCRKYCTSKDIIILYQYD